jgi:hypothetical protein
MPDNLNIFTACHAHGPAVAWSLQRVMRHSLTLLTVVMLALPLAGCVLPFPSRTCVRNGITGRVVDAHTEAVVTNANVTVAYAQPPFYEQPTEHQVMSTRTGEFRVRSEYQQHWFYIFGVALNHPWPHPHHFGGPDLPISVTIQHPDYEPLTYTFQRKEQPTALPDRPMRVPIVEQSRVFRLTPSSSTP